MSESLILLSAGIFFLVSAVLSLGYLRWEYRQRGKLSWFGSLVHIAVFAINGIFIGILTWGTGEVPPMQGLPWLGIPLIVIGLGVVVYAMDLFRQFSRWVGNATPGLVTRGLYTFSRNPQSVGYGLAILGVVIAWGGWLGWLGFLSYAALIYGVVRVEEEHLTRVYGQAYLDYCQQIPRFLGLPEKQKTITAEAK